MKDSIKTEHFKFNHRTNQGFFKLNGISIKFKYFETVPATNTLVFYKYNSAIGSVKISKYNLKQEINKVKTFIANYQYCYK